jgi:CPA1 family monovalent cation:H+ antiporter
MLCLSWLLSARIQKSLNRKKDPDLTTLSQFDAAAVVIVLTAVLGYFNHRFLGLPRTMALMMLGALTAVAVVVVDALFPASPLRSLVKGFLDSIDFHATLMNGLLSFLLFAGALHVDLKAMRSQKWHILLLSTVGVLISTTLVGVGTKIIALAAGVDISILWALLFGALISPTDPVAVLGVLKKSNLPSNLQAIVGGESLFNDGIGVVIFTIIFAAATGTDKFSWGHAFELFIWEAVGGIAFGWLVGWLAFLALRSIDEYNVEVMITLAVVMGGYALAQALGVSGPVAMAVAGLLLGNVGVERAMSDTTQDYLLKFWSLVDEILNSVLFLLIGLEIIAVPIEPHLLIIGACAIPIVLAARAISVGAPMILLRPWLPLPQSALPILTWGALRGGISIALALSLPAGLPRNVVLTATCAVVLFSVLVQGSTLSPLIGRLKRAEM